jgi:DNA modification methylase
MHINPSQNKMQFELFTAEQQSANKTKSQVISNQLQASDRAFHDWYRFVLSFPAHLVRDYINQFNLNKTDTILDPFCGTGTTLVEAKLQGFKSIGIEANPIAHFASRLKINWAINPDELLEHAQRVAKAANNAIKASHHTQLRTLPQPAYQLLIKNSISPLPLHKALILLEQIKLYKNERIYEHELLAFAKVLVYHASNLHFGPEVGVSRRLKQDAQVIENWLSEIKTIAHDLSYSQPEYSSHAISYHADARQLENLLIPNSINAVFTSPPYPNEKDYTRTTRLESVLLGFINDKIDLRRLKQGLLRSNTRNVYKGDNDDMWVSEHEAIQEIADTIEKRRIALGKTSGFEKRYSLVTQLYFGGMARHLAQLRPFLKKGAYLGYVVGDQASYLRVLIKTGTLLADIAQSLGYELESIDLFRTRFATATKQAMREEVVVLRWPGKYKFSCQ